MRRIPRIVLVPLAAAALALLPRVSLAQQAEACSQALPAGYPVPAGYHVHQHEGHIHLCLNAQARPPQPQQQQQPVPNPAAVAFLQQRIQKAQEDYQSCLRDRASMTSGVIRASMNCEGWLTIIQQLQANLRQAQGW